MRGAPRHSLDDRVRGLERDAPGAYLHRVPSDRVFVQVDAQTLEVYEEGKERIAVFTGNVVVKRGDTTLKATSIKLHQDLQGKSDAFSKIEADGGVSVRSKDQTLTGKTAVVDMVANSIVVSGGVVLSQGPNVLTGTRLVVDLNTGRARLEGETVRGVFTPSTSQ